MEFRLEVELYQSWLVFLSLSPPCVILVLTSARAKDLERNKVKNQNTTPNGNVISRVVPSTTPQNNRTHAARANGKLMTAKWANERQYTRRRRGRKYLALRSRNDLDA
jgi:hypothetical protein